MSSSPLILALPKGRLEPEARALFEKVGISWHSAVDGKTLMADSLCGGYRILSVRAADVPVYVRLGAADVGIAGKDQLLEQGLQGLYELVDARIGICRLVVAGPRGFNLDAGGRRLLVATKYVRSARRWFAAQRLPANVVQLYGSLELAPLTGLADVIVDIVETGNTLRAHDLEPLAEIAPVSSRLIANRASLKTRGPEMRWLIAAFAGAVDRSGPAGP